jgi:hypothetical protein
VGVWHELLYFLNFMALGMTGIAQIPFANLKWLPSLRNGKFFNTSNKMQSEGILK